MALLSDGMDLSLAEHMDLCMLDVLICDMEKMEQDKALHIENYAGRGDALLVAARGEAHDEIRGLRVKDLLDVPKLTTIRWPH